METITFYSYKGGTGRTLLVAHAARYLALLGRRVVAIDLDLEAPGLHYRLNIGVPGERAADVVPGPGVVDYLHDSLASGSAPAASLKSCVMPVAIPPQGGGRLWLMPAGPAPSGAYWKRLTALFRMDPFLDAKGVALAAVLDLKARIEDELQPDYLLVDSRTGITELGGIATSVLADKVVCLFINNRESLAGTRAVMQSLGKAVRPRGQGPIEVFPVMSRVSEPRDHEKTMVLRFLNENGTGDHGPKAFDKLFLLRTDPEVEVEEYDDLEERTSWLSGVYGDYRFLLSVLAPADPAETAHAWSRHESVQEMLDWLTKDYDAGTHRRVDPQPFDADQIDEGVRLGGRTVRFADLVAFSGDDRTEPLLAAEYVDDDLTTSVAWQWWQKNSRLRCVILFNKKKNAGLQRRVFTRSRGGREFVERTDDGTWGVRWPLSYSALDDPGDLSTSSLLRAVQKGEDGFIPLLLGRWQRGAHLGFGGRFPFQPGAARAIVDGLAAVRHHGTEEGLLWQTGPDPFQRHWRIRDGGQVEEQTTRELHALLWWRLSARAKVQYWHHREGPHEVPSGPPAGVDLLARDVLGLSFDQDRELRVAVARVFGPEGEASNALWDFVSLFRERELKLEISAAVPPELVRRVLLDRARRAERTHNSGGKAWDAAAGAASDVLNDDDALSRLFRGADGRLCVVTTNLLGEYESSSSRVILYPRLASWCAGVLGVDLRALENVILLHETVHAVCHLGRDLDGRKWDDFSLPSSRDPAFRPSALHEGLAQYFSYRMIERLGDEAMMAAFEALSSIQPPQYQQWREMRAVPVERVREVLMQARSGLADSLSALR